MRISRLSALLRFLGLFLMAAVLLAPSLSALAAAPAPVNFALRPGGKATIKVFAFCLDQTKKFPFNSEVRPSGLGDQKLRQGLAYIVDKNYDQTQFKQAAFALWFLRDGNFHNNGESTAIAQEIVNAAATTQAPGGGQGMALQDAQAQGIVDAKISNFSAVSGAPDPNNNYFGVGTLEVVNKSNSNQQLYLAFGTTFPAPSPDFQAVITYGTQVLSAEQPVQTTLPNTGDSPFLALLCASGLVALGIGWSMRRTAR